MARGVLSDPTARLYAGALLGKALVKELGEAGRTADSEKTAQRRATLTAGVASGKINPSQLGGSDLALLGQSLSKHGGPNLFKDPIGFLGKGVSNLGSDIGNLAENWQAIPQGLLGAGKAAVEELGQAVTPPGDRPKTHPFSSMIEKAGEGVAHDFSSPKQIYEHPLNPLLDVSAAFSGGATLGAKAASSLARAGKYGGEADIAASNAIGPKLIRMASPEGRAPAIVSPAFHADRLEGISPAEIPRRYAGGRPVMKYVVQKPLDSLISKLGERHLPGESEETIKDLQGRYHGRKLINRTRAEISAGTNEAFLNSPVGEYFNAVRNMSKESPGAGQYQQEAMILHKVGVNSLDKLDEYKELLKRNQDIDGEVLDPEMLRANMDRVKMYEDERFRQLIERPTPFMKEASHALDKLNIEYARKLNIDPSTTENSMFGRLREMTGKTNQELRAEQLKGTLPYNNFAKGLETIVHSLGEGEATAEVAPTIHELSMNLPYGTMPARESLIERAIESFKEDHEALTNPFDRNQDPHYVPGETLYDKIAYGLHDELGVSEEEAQAFARGISYGSPAGPIMLGYVPSVSGEGLKYGKLREPISRRVGRNLGVAKFQPLPGEEHIDTMPGFYDFKRPFNPRSVSAQTLGLGPHMHYLKQADYSSFLKGVQDIRPQTIAKNAYTIQKDFLTRKLDEKTIEKLAVKKSDGSVYLFKGPGEMIKTLGATSAQYYDFVPVSVWRKFIKDKTDLEIEGSHLLEEHKEDHDIETQLEELADENAQRFVTETTHAAASGPQHGVALPKTFTKQVMDHIKVAEQGGGLTNLYVSLVGRWKSAVLSYMPSWLFRTTVGHGLIAVIDGTVGPQYWMQASKYFNDRPIMPEDVGDLRPWKKAGDTQLGSKFHPEGLPPGVNQGSMMHELGDIGQGERERKQLLPARAISSVVHQSTNFQRRAIALRSLDRDAKQRFAELGKDFEHPGGFWNSKNIDAVLDPTFRENVLKSPDLLEHMKDQVSKVSYTFGEMSPWERKLVKYGMPFWGWYKFITKFAWGLPFNYPGRAFMLTQLGKLGVETHEHLGYLPNYLSGSLFFDTHNPAAAHYINLYGLNPLNDFASPFGHEGALESMVRLGQMSPVLQAGLAGFGINPTTGAGESIDPSSGIETGRYGELIDLNTGRQLGNAGNVFSLPRILGTFARSFPEIRTAELLQTGGNPVYPESIPFFDSKPIAVRPESRRGGSFLSALAGLGGVQPREYNFPEQTAKMVKKYHEAFKKHPKTLAKAQQRLAKP